MSTQNKALVRTWFEEVWNKRRVSAIDEMLLDSAVVHGLGSDLNGPAGFKPFHEAYLRAFPDLALQIDVVIAEGDVVAARWSGTGTHQGDGLGFPATGKRVQFFGMVFARIERGHFIEGWNNFDQFGMLQQLGVLEPPAAVR